MSNIRSNRPNPQPQPHGPNDGGPAPARLVVYYVLAMALFSSSGYEEVMRRSSIGPSTVPNPSAR